MAKLLRTLCVLTAILFYASPAFAQRHVGVRAGISSAPDQFVFGAHVETRPVLTNLTFRPNVEIGVGDNTTLVALNVEFAYWIPLDKGWRLYAGAGPAANIYDNKGRRGSNVGGGVNFLVGAQHDGGLFLELKVGAVDSPSLKVMVGYAIK